MNRILIIFFLLLLTCDNKRVVELPAIESSQISEVLDVSPAYIFYDETQIDSVLFNRKNLIGTTNWLVNVDKRLSLKQTLPHLQYLQSKRRKKGMHTNEQAKNYFTCNNTTTQSLGFIEFTFTNFNEITKLKDLPTNEQLILLVYDLEHMETGYSLDSLNTTDIHQLEATLRALQNPNLPLKILTPIIDEDLTFQDYIKLKESMQGISKSLDLSSADEYFLNLNSLN